MIIRDSRNERLHVEVNNQAIVEIVGNIEARDLVEMFETTPLHNSSTSAQFHTSTAVTSLLNALVEDSTQTFEAQLLCTTLRGHDSASQPSDSYQDSSHGDIRVPRRAFNVVSLLPNDTFLI